MLTFKDTAQRKFGFKFNDTAWRVDLGKTGDSRISLDIENTPIFDMNSLRSSHNALTLRIFTSSKIRDMSDTELIYSLTGILERSEITNLIKEMVKD